MSDEYKHVPLKFKETRELHPKGTAERIAALEAQLAERDKLIQMAWDATLDFRTVHNSRPSSWAECEKQTAQTICDCNDALEAFLYPEPQPPKEPK